MNKAQATTKNKENMSLLKDSVDDLRQIQIAIAIWVSTAGEEIKEKRNVEAVRKFVENLESNLRNLDQRMTAVIKKNGTDQDLVMWAVRMRQLLSNARTITMNLAFWGKHEWSWQEVINSMAYLYEVMRASESTIELNECSEPE